MTSCTLGDSGDVKSTFYVVGTAFVDVSEREPSQGRVLVFQVTDSKLKKSYSLRTCHRESSQFNVFEVCSCITAISCLHV